MVENRYVLRIRMAPDGLGGRSSTPVVATNPSGIDGGNGKPPIIEALGTFEDPVKKQLQGFLEATTRKENPIPVTVGGYMQYLREKEISQDKFAETMFPNVVSAGRIKRLQYLETFNGYITNTSNFLPKALHYLQIEADSAESVALWHVIVANKANINTNDITDEQGVKQTLQSFLSNKTIPSYTDIKAYIGTFPLRNILYWETYMSSIVDIENVDQTIIDKGKMKNYLDGISTPTINTLVEGILDAFDIHPLSIQGIAAYVLLMRDRIMDIDKKEKRK